MNTSQATQNKQIINDLIDQCERAGWKTSIRNPRGWFTATKGNQELDILVLAGQILTERKIVTAMSESLDELKSWIEA